MIEKPFPACECAGEEVCNLTIVNGLVRRALLRTSDEKKAARATSNKFRRVTSVKYATCIIFVTVTKPAYSCIYDILLSAPSIEFVRLRMHPTLCST